MDLDKRTLLSKAVVLDSIVLVSFVVLTDLSFFSCGCFSVCGYFFFTLLNLFLKALTKKNVVVPCQQCVPHTGMCCVYLSELLVELSGV